MSERHEFDFCVVGAGSAGYAAAVTARRLGKTVAVVDGMGPLAGLCILRGCMPSKTLLRSAEVAHLVRTADKVGVTASDVTIDFAHVMARKRRIIKDFADYRVAGIETFPLFRGDAVFESPDVLAVGDRHIAADKFLVATGSVVNVPPIPGLAQAGYLTSDDVLELDELPRSVVVLGGGPTACELAQYLARLGVETTMVQRSGTLLSGEDSDVGAALRECLERDGIRVETGSTITAVESAAGVKSVHYQCNGRPHSVDGAAVFAALGRRANVDGPLLEKAGIKYTAEGIAVDAYLRTSNPKIYAAGDVVHDSSQLVHVAVHEGELAARNAFADEPAPLDGRFRMSRAVFTDPQVAVTGLTERECTERGVAHQAARYPFGDLGKAISTELTDGFVKMIAAPDGTILGVTMVGAEAADMIHEAIALLYFRANCRDVMLMAHLHPTLAEIITYPAEELCERLEHEARALVTP